MLEKNDTCCCQEDGHVCTKVTTQCADVSLPVQIKPYAAIGQIETSCGEEPTIVMRQQAGCPCSCEFVINQCICVRIPIEYGSIVETGEVNISCKRPNTSCGFRP